MLPDITAAATLDRIAVRRVAAEHAQHRTTGMEVRARLGRALVALGTRLAPTSTVPCAPTISRSAPTAVTIGR